MARLELIGELDNNATLGMRSPVWESLVGRAGRRRFEAAAGWYRMAITARALQARESANEPNEQMAVRDVSMLRRRMMGSRGVVMDVRASNLVVATSCRTFLVSVLDNNCVWTRDGVGAGVVSVCAIYLSDKYLC